MIIGVPKEIKNHEYRVGLIPSGVKELVKLGHQVIIQSNAGAEIGIFDEDYVEAGAIIAINAQEVYSKASLIVKVKEPLASERAFIHSGHTLFTYLHLAADELQTQDLINSNAICIAYETVTDQYGMLPLLSPMSEIAGRMAVQAGATTLHKSNGGSGVLLSGVPGVAAGNVVILGGGSVGSNAARMAVGMGANVTLFDKNIAVLRRLDNEYQGRIDLVYATEQCIADALKHADLVIGAVLVPGGAAPKVVTKNMLKHMKPGSVMVDVAIDQGGCFETSVPTTHDEPTYSVEGVVHYCVGNMPSAVARTAAFALCNATLPFVQQLAQLGTNEALKRSIHLQHGVNIYKGKITHEGVSQTFNMPLHDLITLLN
ncbi:alanine dehydrogenase [Thorsellia anophelis]|uniref:Alanine dehydrogenase n=1 Tax=Thorsellia anophelis DSM 18579 TaxID=1123402 RepID=A0A1I0DHU8_9GAMM|nr:alanine dehydrogenase [Thorsellia anophelis]SET31798.1 L-alanine dehydrogenase [Thorsellia anophelis DSM 18579]